MSIEKGLETLYNTRVYDRFSTRERHVMEFLTSMYPIEVHHSNKLTHYDPFSNAIEVEYEWILKLKDE